MLSHQSYKIGTKIIPVLQVRKQPWRGKVMRHTDINCWARTWTQFFLTLVPAIGCLGHIHSLFAKFNPVTTPSFMQFFTVLVYMNPLSPTLYSYSVSFPGPSFPGPSFKTHALNIRTLWRSVLGPLLFSNHIISLGRYIHWETLTVVCWQQPPASLQPDLSLALQIWISKCLLDITWKHKVSMF